MAKTWLGKALADTVGLAKKSVLGAVGIETSFVPQSGLGKVVDKVQTVAAPLTKAVAGVATGGATTAIQGVGSAIQSGSGVGSALVNAGTSLAGIKANPVNVASLSKNLLSNLVPSITAPAPAPVVASPVIVGVQSSGSSKALNLGTMFSGSSLNSGLFSKTIVEAPPVASSEKYLPTVIQENPTANKTDVWGQIKDWGKDILTGAKDGAIDAATDRFLETPAGREAKKDGAISWAKDNVFVWLSIMGALFIAVIVLVFTRKK